MPYKKNLKKASVLKQELDGFRPLSSEAEKRIMQKFRLDWNYHSSHIEGNTLTYGETKALILFGQTARAKPLKDHLEMSGHDEAIKYLEEIVKQERPITENFIRELHTMILKEPYEVDAITPDGKQTKKKIKIGQYKTTSNHIKTPTGEIFYFASPEETPAKMTDLMTWYNKNINRPDSHLILFATEYHYRFVRIHPFDDGNGRVARLLMNFILMQKGYPPAIIKTEEKDQYFRALQQADAGQIEYFFNYVCEQVIHSLEMMIKGARGESIEDEDDLDKEISLLKAELSTKPEVKLANEPDIILNLYKKSFRPLFKKLHEKLSQFDELFLSKEAKCFVNSGFSEQKGDSSFHHIDRIFQKNEQYIKSINELQEPRQRNNIKSRIIEIKNISYHANWVGFTKNGTNTFDMAFKMEIKFDKMKYHYLSGNNEILKQRTKLYQELIGEKETNEIVNIYAKYALAYIKKNIGKK